MGRGSRNIKRDAAMIQGLCEWFSVHGRDLPWRRRRTGYRGLVAEAMLQQTQVSRVLPRFKAFIQRIDWQAPTESYGNYWNPVPDGQVNQN